MQISPPALSSAATNAHSPAMEARLARLEEELRATQQSLAHSAKRSRRRIVVSVVSSIVGTAMLMAAGLPEAFNVVRTKRLEIVDEQNRVVGLFTASADGGQLDLWSTGGANAARLGVSPRGGDFATWTATGKPSVGAFAAEGGGRFEVYDEAGRTMGHLGASRSGGELQLKTPLGKPGVIAKCEERGGGIAACDSVGRPLAELSVHDGAGFVLVADRNARPVATLRSTERGGAIDVADANGAPAFSAGADVGGGSMTLSGANRKPLVTVGAAESGGGRLSVCNTEGAEVIVANSADSGTGRFLVSSPDGSRGVIMQGSANSFGLGILESAKRVLMLEGNGGGGRLELTDLRGRAAAILGIESGGSDPAVASGESTAGRNAADSRFKVGAFSLRDDSGKELVRISADEKGNGRMAVYNRSGEERKFFGVK